MILWIHVIWVTAVIYSLIWESQALGHIEVNDLHSVSACLLTDT